MRECWILGLPPQKFGGYAAQAGAKSEYKANQESDARGGEWALGCVGGNIGAQERFECFTAGGRSVAVPCTEPSVGHEAASNEEHDAGEREQHEGGRKGRERRWHPLRQKKENGITEEC